MNLLKYFSILPLLFFILTNSGTEQNSRESSSVIGSFAASTPCSQGTRPVPGIPVNADCELIKWNLTLFMDESQKTSGTYELHCVYGLPKQGTTGLIGGGKNVDMKGRLNINKGIPSNHDAIVYQLHDSKTNKTISFLKLSDDLLHLLDSDQRLMIGSAAWSYTLNRIVNNQAKDSKH